MKNKSRAAASAVIGTIIFVTTLVIYFFSNTKIEKSAVDMMALLFALLAELLLFGSMITLNLLEKWRNKVFVKAGIITALIFYWLISTVFSLTVRNLYIDRLSTFFTIQFVMLAAVICICIIIFVSYQSSSEKSQNVVNAGEVMKKSENIAKMLSTNPKYLTYKQALNRIYEDIKYSDKSKMVLEDNDIFEKISVLADTLCESAAETDLINRYIEEIKEMIKKRNLAVRALNRGEI